MQSENVESRLKRIESQLAQIKTILLILLLLLLIGVFGPVELVIFLGSGIFIVGIAVLAIYCFLWLLEKAMMKTARRHEIEMEQQFLQRIKEGKPE